MIPTRNDSVSSMMSVGESTSDKQPNHRRASVGFSSECKDLRPEDVICSKGRTTKSHPGNMRYDTLIQQNRERYQACQCRGDKTRITHEIIQEVTQSGGRFLKFDPDARQWSELNQDLQREKVSHALRSCRRASFSAAAKQNKSSGGSSSRSLGSKDSGETATAPTAGDTMSPQERERLRVVYNIQQNILRGYDMKTCDEFHFDDNLSVY